MARKGIEKRPSIEQNQALVQAFDYLNASLFNKELPTPMLMFTRSKQVVGGYFCADRWENEEGKTVHELALNANVMHLDLLEQYAIMLHEMVHLWQQAFGKPSRAGYHNEEWAAKMKDVGLQPLATDGSGKETGQSVGHTIIEGGRFEEAMIQMPDDAIFPWIADKIADDEEDKPKKEEKAPKAPKSGKRNKYTCPACGLNVWAKYGAKIMCMDCDQMLIGSELQEEMD